METSGRKRLFPAKIKLPANLRRQNLAVLGTLIAVCVLTTALNPVFINPNNLTNVMRQIAILGVISAGQAMLMISGGIDLSVGASVSLCGVIVAMILVGQYGEATAIVAGILLGGLIGMINGLIVSRTKIQPFIATLGMMSILQGLALVAANGRQIPNVTGSLIDPIGEGMLGFVPVPVIIMAAVLVLCHITLRYTKFGRNWYAMGGNEETAYLSGIDVTGHKVLIYTITGLLVGLASVMLVSRIGAAIPTMGTGYELQSIAAVVIGGVALSGGRGSIFGAFLGVLLLGVIANSLNLLNINAFYQNAAVGLVILIAVIANEFSQRR